MKTIIASLLITITTSVGLAQIRLPKLKAINDAVKQVDETVNSTDKLNKDIKTAKGDKKEAQNQSVNNPTETGQSSSTQSGNRNNKFKYDSEGYIIEHPVIMDYLKKQEKYYYVTPFKETSKEYDYALVKKEVYDEKMKIYDIKIKYIIKTKQENLYKDYPEHFMFGNGSTYNNPSNDKLYYNKEYITSFEGDGTIISGKIDNGIIKDVTYLNSTKEAAQSSVGRYIELKNKLEQYYKVSLQQTKKDDKVNEMHAGMLDYNDYFTNKYKSPALEATLIKVATDEHNDLKSEVEKFGKMTIKKMSLNNSDWSVMKNNLGIPTYKQFDAYVIGTGSNGSCFIKYVSFKKEYEGGGKYSNTIHLRTESTPQLLPCDKVK